MLVLPYELFAMSPWTYAAAIADRLLRARYLSRSIGLMQLGGGQGFRKVHAEDITSFVVNAQEVAASFIAKPYPSYGQVVGPDLPLLGMS